MGWGRGGQAGLGRASQDAVRGDTVKRGAARRREHGAPSAEQHFKSLFCTCTVNIGERSEGGAAFEQRRVFYPQPLLSMFPLRFPTRATKLLTLTQRLFFFVFLFFLPLVLFYFHPIPLSFIFANAPLSPRLPPLFFFLLLFLTLTSFCFAAFGWGDRVFAFCARGGVFFLLFFFFRFCFILFSSRRWVR